MRQDVATQLYTEPPERFVAARDEAVAEARATGDLDAARQIAKLRKPTVAAWLVNLLAHRRPELVDELADLSAALRAAQRNLRGAELRDLSKQRRQAVAALVAAARALAVAEDPLLARAKLPLADVENTLNAALSDEHIAAQVRSGRLVRAAVYAGFGEVPRPRLRLVTDDEAPPAERAPEQAEEDRRGALVKELEAARTEAARVEKDLVRAVDDERRGAEALAEIEDALADLERRRAVAEQEMSQHKLARKSAERAVATARRRTGEVEGALEALDQKGAGRAQSGA
ncbi:coiled-coil domain-containing protein [Phytohabitans aurantiacus]|uniref:Transposase n=1 Tax=Phytohabitans aurantiacus TaxID=3016789 RepID=A0ABQ5QVE4_9ACTN|nr:hypothetical protein [Phytohabitans aurantiacus]GLH98237.1 hypothetical protein Pa4123_35120 [Phytohabitans aurantiacus]